MPRDYRLSSADQFIRVDIMTTHGFQSLRAMVKRLAVLIISAVAFLSFTQTAAIASTFRPAPNSLVLLEIPEVIPDQELSEKQEQRREWQSKASATQNVKDDSSESLGETLNEKLNLNEITETMKENLNLDGADSSASEQSRSASQRSYSSDR
jgi:hypothetical protein